MSAIHTLITNGSYSPDEITTIGQAFDELWAEIAGNFGDNTEIARERLANIFLGLAAKGLSEKHALKQMAVELHRADMEKALQSKQSGIEPH